jgi:hypothetical protein
MFEERHTKDVDDIFTVKNYCVNLCRVKHIKYIKNSEELFNVVIIKEEKQNVLS